MNHKGTITIETKRLILRQFVESDVLATFNNWTSDEKITEFLRWQMHSSIEVTENIVKEWISLYNNKDFYQWAIVLKEYNNETIGTISVVDKNEKLNILHIGYCIGSNWWNKGITTGFGNTSAKQGAENTLRLIKLSNCGYDVPVAVGAEYNLDGECDPAPKHIHGDNGIGNVDLPESDQKILNEPAEDFIIRKANELNGDLIIVTLGRLTNIAKALEKDPRLPYKVKNVISMGGCLNKPGNITPYAEANIYGDARASDIVVSAGFHMMLVGLDVTTETFITLENLRNLKKYCSQENLPIVEYMESALSYYFNFHYETMGSVDRCVVHDPLAMILSEDPTIGDYKLIRARVEHDSTEYRGMIKTDNRFMSIYDHDEILYCTKVNADHALRKILSVYK